MDRLETNSLSKEELLAQMVPQKVETRTTCTSPTNASEPNLAKKRNMQEKKVEGNVFKILHRSLSILLKAQSICWETVFYYFAEVLKVT